MRVAPSFAALALVAAVTAADPPQAPRPAQTRAQLAAAAKAVFTTHCYRCHGKDGADEGGFGSVLDRRRLVESKLVTAGDATRGRLLRRVTKGEMPPPEEKVKLPAADLDTLKRWVEGGAPDWDVAVTRQPIAIEDEARLVASDLAKVPRPPGSQPDAFYFSLTPLYNAGAPDDELDAHRVGFFKLVNSFSTRPEIVLPVAINPEKTVYRFSREMIGRKWLELRGHPYGLAMRLPETGGLESNLPFRMDWFLSAGSRTDLYHHNADIPKTVAELEERLKVHAADNIRDALVIRAGFNGSGVSRHNRMIERHEGAYGYYWKSYDFAGSKGRQNLFAHPLGPGPSAAQDTFRHDGGEIIFRLPNGLHGYMLADSRGNRLDRGPTEIVSDPKHPEKVVENGVSCMSCHAGGMIDKADQIRPLAEPADAPFPRATRDAILALYPPREKFEEAVKADTADYRAALAKVGVKPDGPDPVSAAARRYEAELDVRRAAAELWVTPEQLLKALKALPADSPARAAVLPLLAPGGTVKRDVFEALFAALARQALPGITTHGTTEILRLPAAPKATAVPGDLFRAGSRTVTANKTCVVIDPTFRLVAVAAEVVDRMEGVHVYDLPTNELRYTVRSRGRVLRIVFSADGTTLACSASDGVIRFADAQSGKELGVTTQPKDRRVGQAPPAFQGLAFSPDGKELAAVAGDGPIHYFDPATGKLLRSVGRANFHLGNLAFTPDGRHLVKTDGWGVSASDPTTDKGRSVHSVGHAGWFNHAFSPDGKFMCVVDSTLAVRLLDLPTFDQIALERIDFNGAQSRNDVAPRAVAVGPDSRHLVVAHRSGYLSVWSVPALKLVRAVRCHPDEPHSLQFTPDGKRLAACGDDGVIRFWDWAALRREPDKGDD
jgi:mono/diheme cytochrome c family protein/DNA-binding beta-propeller fold protein YncE